MPAIDITGLEHDLLLKGVWEGLGMPPCHATGGYVRDRLLGRENPDLDLVLPGDLDDARGPARRLAARLDTRAHTLGREVRQVWRIETPEINIELWPPGDLSFEDDIRRRDFSINALVWHLPDGPLEDRVEGLEDLAHGRLRAISKKNLADDPVRLVRAPRFLAQLGDFKLDEQTARWIRDLGPRLRKAPRERVGQELLKLLRASGAALGLRSLIDLGLLAPAGPEDGRCDPEWLEGHSAAPARLSGAAPHPVPIALREAGDAARLGLLLRLWGEPSENTVAAYAWERGDRRNGVRAAALLEHALAAVSASAADRRAFIHSAGASFPAAFALAAAVDAKNPGWRRWWRMWRERRAELLEPRPLLSGNEIVAHLGLEPGPELGRAVDALTEAQIRREVRTTGGARRWLAGWWRMQGRLWP
jgi:tRNA nucleotidyltransferase (CCA-adding enzyme)